MKRATDVLESNLIKNNLCRPLRGLEPHKRALTQR